MANHFSQISTLPFSPLPLSDTTGWRSRFLIALTVAFCWSSTRVIAAERIEHSETERTSQARFNETKLNVIMGNRTVSATLANNQTARDFASLLPLTVTMQDLLHREKFAGLPRELQDSGPRSRRYEVGQIIYWSPGPDIAIYYRQDGSSIPAPGTILIGNLDGEIPALDEPGDVVVRIEVAR